MKLTPNDIKKYGTLYEQKFLNESNSMYAYINSDEWKGFSDHFGISQEQFFSTTSEDRISMLEGFFESINDDAHKDMRDLVWSDILQNEKMQ